MRPMWSVGRETDRRPLHPDHQGWSSFVGQCLATLSQVQSSEGYPYAARSAPAARHRTTGGRMSGPSVTSHSNGGPPARLATIAEILAASEPHIMLPRPSATVGEACSLKVRKLARAEVLLCLPPTPPGPRAWGWALVGGEG